jgi:hypothetical protein
MAGVVVYHYRPTLPSSWHGDVFVCDGEIELEFGPSDRVSSVFHTASST